MRTRRTRDRQGKGGECEGWKCEELRRGENKFDHIGETCELMFINYYCATTATTTTTTTMTTTTYYYYHYHHRHLYYHYYYQYYSTTTMLLPTLYC
jgi:hypothetical protein